MAMATGWLPQHAEARERSGETSVRTIDIPALPLPAALAELSRQTGISIGTEGRLPAVRTRPVRGKFSPAEALRRMLAGINVEAQRISANAWRIVPVSGDHRRSANASAAALPAPPPPTIDPVPIVVTATKSREEWINAPRSIAVVVPDAIRQSDADAGTAAVARNIEGLTLVGSGSGRNQMFLRGVADSPFGGMNQATVAVLLDGVRITYSAPDPDLRLDDVKRVEILKGPQGSLYGIGVLGGIYQIITNPADVSQSSASVGAGLSLVSGGSLGESGSAVVNLPLVPETMALRLVGYGSHKAGWVHTGARRDANALDTYGGRLGLGVELGSGWRLDAKGLAQRLQVADTQYVYSAGARSRPDQYPEPHVNGLEHVALQLDGSLGDVKLVALSGQTWQHSSDQLDASIGAAALGLANPIRYTDARKHRVWDTELHVSGKLGAFDWLAGISHVEAHRAMDRRLFSTSPVASLQVDAGYRTSIDSAVFGNATFNIGSGFALQGGGRLFRVSSDDERTIAGVIHAISARKVGFTPEGAVMWRPLDGRLFFVRYGSAFRLGGLTVSSPLFDEDCVAEGDCGDVEATAGDDLKTIEAGWREQFGRGGSLDISSYYTSWRNVQSDFLTSTGLTQSGRVGDARIIGTEITLNVPLGPWQLGLGGVYQDTRLVDFTASEIGAENARLPVVPKYSGRFALKRNLKLGKANGWLRATLRYVGPSRLSFDPALDRPMGNYIDAGIEGRIVAGRFEFGVEVENIFANSGDTFALGNQFRAATMRQYTPQVPASVSTKLMVHF